MRSTVVIRAFFVTVDSSDACSAAFCSATAMSRPIGNLHESKALAPAQRLNLYRSRTALKKPM
jgi:hypothetical protein